MWILELLREQGARVTLIGDPDQCIYEFNMAQFSSLSALREKWDLPEKPLSNSFRCNNKIADAVKVIGGNHIFMGNGLVEERLLYPFYS